MSTKLEILRDLPLLFFVDKSPPPGIGPDWTTLDLSTAFFHTYGADTYGQYADGVIKSFEGNSPTFSFWDLELDETQTYEIELTFTVAEAGNQTTFFRMMDYSNNAWENEATYQVLSDTHSESVHVITVGPGIGQWNTATGLGYTGYGFEVGLSDEISLIRIRTA